jgi:carboxyl-terminal processing protease
MTGIRAARLSGLALLSLLALQPETLPGQAAPVQAPADAIAAFRRILATRYVTPVDAESLVKAQSMDDLLRLVRIDPFTDVYSPTEWQQLSVALGESFGGIGAVLGSIRDTVVLGDILPDGPAASAGLKARDRLVTIDDSVATGWTVTHAVSRIRGRPGTPLILGVVRGSRPVTQIRLTRDVVQSPSIAAASLSPSGLGVITISQFGPGLTENLGGTIDGMLARGLTRLVIDLRHNPGGLLDEAIGVANLFLPQGTLLVETRYRGKTPDRHLAERPTRFPDLPLAVLVGPESASASEIVAGALQDDHRALIVGGQTYGKGLVQTAAPLADGWMTKFTAGRWYTPAGRLIDRGVHASTDSTKPFDPTGPHTGGIEPDLVVADSMQDADRRAVTLLDHAGASVYLALDDEVGHFLGGHPDLDPGLDPVAGSAARIFAAAGTTADSLADSARAALTPWLDAQVTRRAIAARYGYGVSIVWENQRDPQITAAAVALSAGNGKLTSSQR